MKRLLAWVSAADDWVNPVAVKEFRQAVQSRWVIAILMLFLLVNLVIMGGYLSLSPDAATNIDGGRNIFSALLIILLVTCIAFVPLYSGIRLSLERNDANIDLLFITTTRPGAIVRGKYFSAMALTLLIFSACMPFMVLTYLLRGIDLPTIFFLLALGFMACAAANALGIFAGSVSGSWFIRGLVDVGALICLIYLTGGTIAGTWSFIEFGLGMRNTGEFWAGIGTALLIELLAVGLLYVLSVALLSPKLSNRMFVPRLYLMTSWAVAGVAMGAWTYVEGNIGPIGVWAVFSMAAWMVTTVTALGERDTWSARVRRRIPRNPLLRAVAFLLYTGSAGGMAWSVLMFAATVIAAWIGYGMISVGSPGTVHFSETLNNMSIVFGYVLCYCLTTAFLRITLFRKLPTPALSVIAVFVGTIAWIVPFLLTFLLSRDWWQLERWYLLGSPLVLDSPDPFIKTTVIPFLLVWLMICVAISAPWGMGQWRRFVPYEETAATE